MRVSLLMQYAVAVVVAIAGSAMAGTLTAQGEGTYYIKYDGACMVDSRKWPEFHNCEAASGIRWKIKHHEGAYATICGESSGKCLTTTCDKFIDLKPGRNRYSQLWRSLERDGKFKLISKIDDFEGEYTCFSKDSTFLSTIGIAESCNGSEKRQLFTIEPVA
ncbi:hypothetical protein THASP1DRAFT_25588 [Thamnocephalis sphaerospora]|uniref:Ricin B lectin domain-containing protein n=1 Tax=Thamnocephalis sphaerospora TaxID=78915 RepID=A0A4P9XJR1_9FUNG|nr:hypothetical protein THASP1DRAFT_25588 [Thamnocephalis sphaerospora]|eukprot:RKP06013.1 hypothetical protein THASP1DRAFT_25588 [Thamnocephalis sphaerospora]